MKTIRLASIMLGAGVLGILSLRVFLPSQEAVRAEASQGTAQPKQEKHYGIGKRTPWTSSRIQGSPEPPPPYKIERAFAKLAFKNPLLLTTAPGINRFFVCEQAGKIFSFPIDPDVAKADLVMDLAKELHSWDKTKGRKSWRVEVRGSTCAAAESIAAKHSGRS